MVLESTMICFDNSEYQRNGDYFPTRLSVQKDGTHLVCMTKTRSNPENTVGLMTIANTVDVLATLTNDVGRVFSKLQTVQPKGDLNLLTGIRIAHLVLKNRQGKNHKMRIVVFVGSPLKIDEAEVIKVAKRLKKENVNIDFISFGEHANNNQLLNVFVNTLNGKDGTGSHLLSVPRGDGFSEALLASPIIKGEDGLGGAGLRNSSFELGIDPNEDPELALALRISLDEQRQRQEDEERQASVAANANGGVGSTGGQTGTGTPRAGITAANQELNSEEAMLERALALSVEPPEDNLPDFGDMTEEEQIAFAMQMSMQDASDENMTPLPKRPQAEDERIDVDEELNADPAYLQDVIEILPAVDPESQAVGDAIGSLNQNKDKKPDNVEKK